MQNWDFFGTKFGLWSHLGPSPKFGTSLERLAVWTLEPFGFFIIIHLTKFISMAWQGVVCWGVDKEGKRKLGKGRLAQNFGQHQLLSQFFLVQPFHRPKAVLYKVLFTCLPISFVFHQNKNKAQGATENVLGKNVREDPFALTPPTFGHGPFGWVGLNACPEGLEHLFTATTVILQILSNWSQSARLSAGVAHRCTIFLCHLDLEI